MCDVCEEEDIPQPNHPQVTTSAGFDVDEGILDDIEKLLALGWVTQFSCQGDDYNHRYIVVERQEGGIYPRPRLFDWCNLVIGDEWDGVQRVTYSSDHEDDAVLFDTDVVLWTRDE